MNHLSSKCIRQSSKPPVLVVGPTLDNLDGLGGGKPLSQIRQELSNLAWASSTIAASHQPTWLVLAATSVQQIEGQGVTASLADLESLVAACAGQHGEVFEALYLIVCLKLTTFCFFHSFYLFFVSPGHSSHSKNEGPCVILHQYTFNSEQSTTIINPTWHPTFHPTRPQHPHVTPIPCPQGVPPPPPPWTFAADAWTPRPRRGRPTAASQGARRDLRGPRCCGSWRRSSMCCGTWAPKNPQGLRTYRENHEKKGQVRRCFEWEQHQQEWC